jgi:uncharacterized coiled-coil protein SlyX
MLEDPLMDDQQKTNGLANWVTRIDQRLTRLEEKGNHQDGNIQRLERVVERLTDNLMQRISIIESKIDNQVRAIEDKVSGHVRVIEDKIDNGQRWLIGFLATSIVTLIVVGAKVIFDAIGHK